MVYIFLLFFEHLTQYDIILKEKRQNAASLFEQRLLELHDLEKQINEKNIEINTSPSLSSLSLANNVIEEKKEERKKIIKREAIGIIGNPNVTACLQSLS